MNKKIKTISLVFGLTSLVVVLHTIYLAKTISESESLTLLFTPFFLAGALFFIESILLTIIFIKHLKQVWMYLLPVFLLSSPVPIYFLNKWIESLPAMIPKAGKLPVTFEEYNSTKELIIKDYRIKDLDSSNVVKHFKDTIVRVVVDTIIYSPDKELFFSIICAEALNGTKSKYCSAYRVGKKQANDWELDEPTGNIWSVCFDSFDDFKHKLRQYYYKLYSINGSSNKPEIWTDKYIFHSYSQ